MDDETNLLMGRPAAARYLGVSLETVKAMIEAGVLQPVVLYPGAWPRVRRADVEALVSQVSTPVDMARRPKR